MPTVQYNLVTFRPEGADYRVFLSIDEWHVAGGLDAVINSATVPVSERSKLPANPALLPGMIEFWWTAPPVNDDGAPGDGDSPDVTLNGIFLVDVSIAFVGKEPGETLRTAKIFHLAFADHRIGFAEPAGGRVNNGELNPDQLPDGYELYENSELVTICLTAMGAPSTPPSTLDGVAPARQLEWYGTHAPSELARLLEHTGHVYCVHSSGLGFIALPGFGNVPAIPAARLSSDVTASTIDRRPTTAIFSTAPTAVVRSFNESGANVPAWSFVAQDHADGMKWKPLLSIAAIGGSVSAINVNVHNGFQGVEEAWREHYRRQVYKCIRLDGTKFPPRSSPILRSLYSLDGAVAEPHLRATIATQAMEGAWVNRPAIARVRSIVQTEGIMIFDEYLGTVSGDETPDLLPFFIPLNEAELKPRFSVEAWDVTREEKLYGCYGFNSGGGSVSSMSEAAARQQLTGFRPGTAIYQQPDLREIWLNDVDSNRTALNTLANSFALQLAQGAALPRRRIEVTGFFAAELSGRVCEIVYSQQATKTTIILDGWQSPEGGGGSQ
jgi:hypothetical protein